MDFNKCFALLEERMQAGPPVAASLPAAPRTALPTVLKDSDDLNPIGSLQLMTRFTDLQTERIKVWVYLLIFVCFLLLMLYILFCSQQTYKYFDQELQDIIEGDAAPRYPLICSEVTQRFSQISKYINDIKVCFGYHHPTWQCIWVTDHPHI